LHDTHRHFHHFSISFHFLQVISISCRYAQWDGCKIVAAECLSNIFCRRLARFECRQNMPSIVVVTRQVRQDATFFPHIENNEYFSAPAFTEQARSVESSRAAGYIASATLRALSRSRRCHVSAPFCHATASRAVNRIPYQALMVLAHEYVMY